MKTGWTYKLVDPLVVQAEKIFAQRQARNLVIDPDLLGEPGWDILLCAFIANGRERYCTPKDLAQELRLSQAMTDRWIAILESRDLIESCELGIRASEKADQLLRTMFGAQLRELSQELGGGDGRLYFSSGNGTKSK